MRRSLAILLGPLAWLLTLASARFPAITERIYSRGIYPLVATVLSTISRAVPFSLAEILLLLLFLYGLFAIIRLIKHCRINIVGAFLQFLAILGVTYFAFVLMWGLNYNRLPFSRIARLDVSDITGAELTLLCEKLITQANTLRSSVAEDEQSIMLLQDGPRGAFQRAQPGYDAIAKIYPELSGRYSAPKGALSSTVLSYMGIAGIYSPFTGEAHVNVRMPHSALPATATHEVAHQHGFNREDEANFIGYLACILHPDIDFRYSGTLLALKYSMNALFGFDQDTYWELRELYSTAVSRDLAFERAFWQSFEGPVEQAADRVNDAYLKANLQEDGVLSYGRMVDLLIAYERKLNLNN